MNCNMYGTEVRWTDQQEREIFGEADPKLVKRFKDFHESNGFIFMKFHEYAEKMLNAGREYCSGWWIINVIRFEVLTSKDPKQEFKINNDFVALLVRLLIWHRPDMKEMFIVKQMKPFNRKMSGEQKRRILEKTAPAQVAIDVDRDGKVTVFESSLGPNDVEP